MARGDLTRRSFLGKTIGGGGIALGARPWAALGATPAGATAHGGDGQLAELHVGRLAGVSPVLAAPGRFDLVGASWKPAQPPRAVELRVRRDGAWSRWAAAGASSHGPDGGLAEAPARAFGEPVWAGGADAVQVRVRAAVVDDLRLHLVSARLPPARAASSRFLPSVYQAGPGQPKIVARHVWANAACRPRVRPRFGDVKVGFVHHTENANSYSRAQAAAMVQSICLFHKYVRGWDDIGYNFLVDRFGQVFEGREGGIDEAVVGAQAGGYNLVSTGVGVLGSFVSATPSAAAMRALAHVLAWKLSLHGVPSDGDVVVVVNPAGAAYSRYPANAQVTLPRISGHRDADSTDCPGDAMYGRLPALRQRTRVLVPQLGSLTLTQMPAPAPPAGAPPGAGLPAAGAGEVLVGGILSVAGGPAVVGASPVAGAKIVVEIRDRHALRPVASAVTAADGSWSTTVGTPHAIVLRAVYAGDGAHPAVISPPLKAVV